MTFRPSALHVRIHAHVATTLASLALATGCADVTRFSSVGDHYEGAVVAGDFVRAALAPTTSLCLVLDANHLQDAPGTLTSNDGRFARTPLRPIPQIWHDPLSTLSFGEGRVQNLVYIVSPFADADALGDITAVLSLMQSGNVEVRLFRGAPAIDAGAGNLFGVFTLTRTAGQCSF
jgi:hypothetical protein